MTKTHAVIGLGFGDEGKGRVVDDLCSHLNNPIVIRFSGGQQAAHNVVHKDGKQHVFANFGSGTLRGIPSRFNHTCTIDPMGILNELEILQKGGVNPKLYINKKCPVTTVYDKMADMDYQKMVKHSSCGVGVGKTKQREENFYSLLFGDLFHPAALTIKLRLIEDYYCNSGSLQGRLPRYPHFIPKTLQLCHDLINTVNISCARSIANEYDNHIFEGSQGLLLDQNIGFFPYVTRSNTDLTNLSLTYLDNLYLVTRAYQTRHGNGPRTNKFIPNGIKSNPYEKNEFNTDQGDFKVSVLDLDLLKYALSKATLAMQIDKTALIITCLDLVHNTWKFTHNQKLNTCATEQEFITKIAEILNVSNVGLSRSPIEPIEFLTI